MPTGKIAVRRAVNDMFGSVGSVLAKFKPLPVALIKRILKARLAEHGANTRQ